MTVICSQSMFKYRDYFFRNLIILFAVQKALICWFAYTSRLMSDEGSWSENGCLHYMSLCMRTISHRWHNFPFPIWCTINHLDSLKIVQFISYGPDLTINIMVPQVISKVGRCIFLKNSLGLGCSWDLFFFCKPNAKLLSWLIKTHLAEKKPNSSSLIPRFFISVLSFYSTTLYKRTNPLLTILLNLRRLGESRRCNPSPPGYR